MASMTIPSYVSLFIEAELKEYVDLLEAFWTSACAVKPLAVKSEEAAGNSMWIDGNAWLSSYEQ